MIFPLTNRWGTVRSGGTSVLRMRITVNQLTGKRRRRNSVLLTFFPFLYLADDQDPQEETTEDTAVAMDSSAGDQEITCRDCGATFVFTAGEQEFYASKDLSAPQRCKDCRAARKDQRRSREMHDAVCAECKAECQVPFKPRPEAEGGKPVLCRDCFLKSRGA